MNHKSPRALAALQLLFLAACGGGDAASPLSAPTITSQPNDQSVSLGQPASFSITAAGSPPLAYQWQRNSAPIAGATASAYTTPNTVAGDNGSTFKVVVSNAAGSTSSVAAMLTVSAAHAGTDAATYKYD